MRRVGHGYIKRLRALLTEFPGIGPAGADICPRRPRTSPGSYPAADVARLASALVRVALDRTAAEELLTAARR